MPEDPYKTLQVDPEADPEVIQAAYRRLAQKYHPDVAPGPEAAARMSAINRAWAILRDPGSRAAHDAERAAAAQANGDEFGSPASAASPTSRAQAPSRGGAPAAGARPDTVSRDWTSGRSNVGSGYDPTTMRAREGLGAAGPPPGNPSGPVLAFGRYAGWSVGEIARRDLEDLEWLDRVPIGRPFREDIDRLLRAAGRRRAAAPESTERRGLFRRR
ncbi:MAG TPA: DnaJ domain-containing protein [Solirubrobacterales bacterium]|nr:DnaJ domain-containing protein [Solirubrobacterales bacterium]